MTQVVGKKKNKKSKKEKTLQQQEGLPTMSVDLNENKIIADLQSGDWYHLNTRWITQKKKFIMSYVSLQYIIFILFLLIIVYIVCIIICFFILYLCNNQGK